MTEPKINQPLDRRSFLSSAAVAGSGLVLLSKAVGQETTTKTEELRVALIGAGSHGQVLLNTCVKIPGIRIQAVCDFWEAYNLQQANRILDGFNQLHKSYTDYREMLNQEKNLQAVIVATPDFCHAEQTVACMKAGLHVYCESMMSNTLEGARQMVQAAKETGKLLQIGFQRRSNPHYRFGYEHVINETKLLGKVTAVNGQWNRSMQPDRGWPKKATIDDSTLAKFGFKSMPQFRNWQWYKNLGNGPLAELGSHQIDVFCWYLDSVPKFVTAAGGTNFYDPATHECFDTVMAVMEFESRKTNLHAFYQTINSNSNFGFFENFMGDQGTFYVSEASGRVKVYREPSAPDWDKWVKIGYLETPLVEPKKKTDASLDVKETVIPPNFNLAVKSNDPPHLPHLVNFFNAVLGKEKLNCPAETAYKTTVVTLKIQEAVKSGQKIAFKPEDFQV